MQSHSNFKLSKSIKKCQLFIITIIYDNFIINNYMLFFAPALFFRQL